MSHINTTLYDICQVLFQLRLKPNSLKNSKLPFVFMESWPFQGRIAALPSPRMGPDNHLFPPLVFDLLLHVVQVDGAGRGVHRLLDAGPKVNHVIGASEVGDHLVDEGHLWHEQARTAAAAGPEDELDVVVVTEGPFLVRNGLVAFDTADTVAVLDVLTAQDSDLRHVSLP